MRGDEYAAPHVADAKEPMIKSNNRHVDGQSERQALKSGLAPSTRRVAAIVVLAVLGVGSALTLAWLVAPSSGRLIADKKLGDAEHAIVGGQNDAARGAYREAIALYTQAGDRRGRAKALVGLGELESKDERSEAARAAYSIARR
jgi:hypothetical protein